MGDDEAAVGRLTGQDGVRDVVGLAGEVDAEIIEMAGDGQGLVMLPFQLFVHERDRADRAADEGGGLAASVAQCREGDDGVAKRKGN